MGRIYASLILASLVVALRAEPAWQTNFDAAKEQAKKENKTLLLDFTGSDWCGYCIKLKSAVFDKPEFATYADKNLVLVELDFPTKKKLPSELKKQNAKLKKQYDVNGFPTILLLNAEGKELGRVIGYEGDSPDAYIKQLEKIIAKQKSS